MRNEKANMIIQYINRLYAEIKEYNNDYYEFKSKNDFYIVLREICRVFEEELPKLSEKLIWKDGYEDANIAVAVLKKYLIDNDMVEQMDLNILKFWHRFSTWYDTEVYSHKFLKPEYLVEDINSCEPIPSINYNQEYMLHYGIDFPLSLEYEIYDFQDIVQFIEIVFDEWIVPDKRYEYTVYVNRLFTESSLPYQLKSGKVHYKGYVTSNSNVILNKKMFEDKLEQSRKLVLSQDKQNKKLALKLIVDCLEYLESIQPEQSRKRDQLAETVSANADSKLVSVLKNEINTLFNIANNYFDIRHNKRNNNQGEVREVLDDPRDIEYIYNRMYATVQLLSSKVKE